MADIVILAKNAEEVAGGKKDSSRAVLTDERTFLAKVRTITGNRSEFADTAYAKIAGYPVHPAVLWADGATLHHFPGLVYSFL